MKRIIGLLLTVFVVSTSSTCGLSGMGTRRVESEAKSILRSVFDDVVVEDVSESYDEYEVICSVNTTGKYYDINARATLKFVYKNGEYAQTGKTVYSDRDIVFHDCSDEYYYYHFRSSSYLFQIKKITKSNIEVRYYMHYWGITDEYSNGTVTWSLKFSRDTYNYTFDLFNVGIPFHIYPDYLEYADATSGNNYTGYRFYKWKPVDPEDYWWFEKAANPPEDQ